MQRETETDVRANRERSQERSFFVVRGRPWRRRLALALALALPVLGLQLAAAPPKPPPSPEAAGLPARWRELRKDSLMAMALPILPGRSLSGEHKAFLKALNQFLADLKPADATYRAGGLYLRARFLLHAKDYVAARKELDAAIKLVPALKHDEAQIPLGIPDLGTLRVLRALTFLADGPEAMLREIEAIPAKADIAYDPEAGSFLRNWGEELGKAGKYAEAIRVFEAVKKFHLWEDEADDPVRRIEVLKYQAKNQGVTL